MATKYTHMTKSGILAKRTTQNRTYTHVVVVNVPAPYEAWTGYTRPAGDFVIGWVGRPELVASAIKSHERYHHTNGETLYAEPINNGGRP